MRDTTSKILKDFLLDEAGAVTVDWVVLTAAIVGIGFLVLVPIGFSATSSAQNVAAYVSAVPVGYGK